MRINLPNQITIGRLLLAVVFFVCLAQYHADVDFYRSALLNAAGVLFIVAGLTDILDGHLARKHNQVTSFGRIIDPFVDKVLVIGAYMFLASDRFVDPSGAKLTHVADWMVVLILGRELFVTSLRGFTESTGGSFAATFYGKTKMLMQSVTVGWILLSLANPVLAPFQAAIPYLVYVTVAVTVLSVIPYLRMARGVLSQMAVPAS